MSAVVAKLPKRFELYAPQPPPEWELAWKAYERIIQEIATEAQRHRTPVLLLAVPAGQVVNRDAWIELCQTGFPGEQAEGWDLDAPRRRLQRLAQACGIPLIDPHDAFVRSQDGPLFFGRVGHLTPKGHALLAATLDERLREALTSNK